MLIVRRVANLLVPLLVLVTAAPAAAQPLDPFTFLDEVNAANEAVTSLRFSGAISVDVVGPRGESFSLSIPFSGTTRGEDAHVSMSLAGLGFIGAEDIEIITAGGSTCQRFGLGPWTPIQDDSSGFSFDTQFAQSLQARLLVNPYLSDEGELYRLTSELDLAAAADVPGLTLSGLVPGEVSGMLAASMEMVISKPALYLTELFVDVGAESEGASVTAHIHMAFSDHNDPSIVNTPPTGCVLEPDAFEPDDSPANARQLRLAAPLQSRSLYPANDHDWATLALAAGQRVEVFTRSETCDTYLTVYGPDRTSVLAEDDDGGRYLDSTVQFTTRTRDVYYIEIRHAITGHTCSTYELGARVATD